MARLHLRGLGVFFVLLAIAATAGAQTPPAAPPSYSVEPLSRALFGEPAVSGMNDRGSLAGSTTTRVAPNDIRTDAFFQPPGGQRQSLGALPGEQTLDPTDINEND